MLIKRTTAFYSSLVLYPIAVLAALAGTIFFHERLLPTLIIGAVFVFGGVFIATTYTHIKGYVTR
jgi:drug/metabolite transporter (DMT)-like permease